MFQVENPAEGVAKQTRVRVLLGSLKAGMESDLQRTLSLQLIHSPALTHCILCSVPALDTLLGTCNTSVSGINALGLCLHSGFYSRLWKLQNHPGFSKRNGICQFGTLQWRWSNDMVAFTYCSEMPSGFLRSKWIQGDWEAWNWDVSVNKFLLVGCGGIRPSQQPAPARYAALLVSFVTMLVLLVFIGFLKNALLFFNYSWHSILY